MQQTIIGCLSLLTCLTHLIFAPFKGGCMILFVDLRERYRNHFM